MTEYKLINPSDPYTFLAKTKESAVLAVFLLGTMYGASPKDDNEENEFRYSCSAEQRNGIEKNSDEVPKLDLKQKNRMWQMHYCLSCMDLLKTGGDMRLH